MKTTRGTISFWACMLFGMAGVTLQLIKYSNNELELSVGEFFFTLTAAVFMFAPKMLTKAFGVIIEKRLGGGSKEKSSSIGGGGVNTGDDGKG